jgi:Ca2+-binding RTX toxin-like protein
VTFDMSAQQLTGEGSDTFTGIDILQGTAERHLRRRSQDARHRLRRRISRQRHTDLRSAAEGQTVYVGPNRPVSALWAQNIARVIGSPYRDRLSVYSGSGTITLGGGRGNHRLVGGPGDDRILGNGGADTCSGGSGSGRITGCEA